MLTQFIQMCGRSVHLLPHLICLVSPFRFDPNRNSRTLHLKFPVAQTKEEVSLVLTNPNYGLICVLAVKRW